MNNGSISSPSKALVALALIGALALPFALRPNKTTEAEEHAKASDAPSRKLVLVSPHWEGIRAEFARAFSAWTLEHFGHRTELEWLDIGGTSDAIRYVKSEFTRSPGGIGIDLFFGGGVDPYIQLADAELLLPIRLPAQALAPLPAAFAGIEVYDPQGRWFGAVLSGFGILYNKKVCERMNLRVPKTWEDLGRPDYLTWIGSGDPRSSGSVHMAYEIILQAYGWDKGWEIVTRMCGNTRNFSRGGGEVPKDVATGEIACGMCIDVYAWRQVAEVGDDRIGFVLPEGLTAINPDGIAALKGAPDPDLSAKFIEFVLSERGQKLWCLKKGTPGGPKEFELDRMPVIPGFASRFGKDAAVSCDPYQWKSGFIYDPVKGSLRWTILNDLIGAAMIDTHSDLVNAWKSVMNPATEDRHVAALLRPPISEAELLQLAEDKWQNAEFRARTRAGWATEARARYQEIAGARL